MVPGRLARHCGRVRCRFAYSRKCQTGTITVLIGKAPGGGGSDREQGVPVRAGPVSGAGAVLRSHAGAAAVRVELGPGPVQERHAAERKWYSAAELHKLWNAEKKPDPDLAWWPENSKRAYQEAFRNLERALLRLRQSKKGLRKGKKLGFPRRKKRGKAGTRSG